MTDRYLFYALVLSLIAMMTTLMMAILTGLSDQDRREAKIEECQEFGGTPTLRISQGRLALDKCLDIPLP